jgi:hypothetical protein
LDWFNGKEKEMIDQKPRKLKLMVCGHGRHGKDTFCEIIANLGYTYITSSLMAAEVVFEAMNGKYGYSTYMDCFEDRHAHREEWFNIISNYNKYDKTRLSALIFSRYDVYAGIRNKTEFLAGQDMDLFNLSIFIDASKRLPPEDITSNEITGDMCDMVIHNNGTEEEFINRVHAIFRKL